MSNGNLTDESLAIVKAAGFTDSQQISNAIESSITECAASACDSTSDSWGCDLPYRSDLASLSNVTALNTEPSAWRGNLVSRWSTSTTWANVYQDYAASSTVYRICYGSTTHANVDIAGIGVYISYLMQVGIVLAAYLYDRTLSTWLPKTAHFLAFRSANALAKVDNLRAVIDGTHRPVMIAALVDFQNAQCYFAITLQGCALFAIWKGGPLLEASTETKANVTTAIIGHVAALGMVCIVFALYILHNARRSSIYVSAVSTLAIGVSIITWTRTRRPAELKTKELDLDIPNVPACGGKVDPTKFCEVLSHPGFTGVEAPIVSICGLAMLWILGRQASGLLAHLQAWRHSWKLRPLAWWRTVQHRSLGFPDIQTGFVVTTLRFLWAPILIEFLYSAIFGVEEAQEHRLIAPFKVTKQTSNPVEDNSKILLNNGKQDTVYRRLDSPSEMELPLVYVQEGVSAPSGQ
ncbi:hypothetical protein D0859_10431 [Hortaea werneckii]|uniref:Uncharacterized protein n=1 Tax=Hortaea werneckii TaxID=91943 RepID=A0A3M7IIY7_HORWE|nr:hypothetical protein D0859_10431 [Hortaea werneckii]